MGYVFGTFRDILGHSRLVGNGGGGEFLPVEVFDDGLFLEAAGVDVAFGGVGIEDAFWEAIRALG